MRIDPLPENRKGRLPAAVVGSILVHALVVALALAAYQAAPDEVERLLVDFSVIEPPPPPPPEPEPEPPKEPEPEPPKPSPLPPPNKKIEKPPEPPKEPPKPVFGVTEDSVAEGDSSVAVRVGNTLMKEPEKELTDPAEVEPYYAPEKRTYELSELDRVPKRIAGGKPKYPPLARRASKTGFVLLKFVISPEGNVGTVEIIKELPPGYGFGQAALEAVKRYRYNAPTMNGIPVSVLVELPIRFTLE